MSLFVLQLPTGGYFPPARKDIQPPRWRRPSSKAAPHVQKKIIARGYIAQKTKGDVVPEWLENCPKWLQAILNPFFRTTTTFILVHTRYHDDIFIPLSPRIEHLIEEEDMIPVEYTPKPNGQHRGKITR